MYLSLFDVSERGERGKHLFVCPCGHFLFDKSPLGSVRERDHTRSVWHPHGCSKHRSVHEIRVSVFTGLLDGESLFANSEFINGTLFHFVSLVYFRPLRTDRSPAANINWRKSVAHIFCDCSA